jgi:hypothetical protein
MAYQRQTNTVEKISPNDIVLLAKFSGPIGHKFPVDIVEATVKPVSNGATKVHLTVEDDFKQRNTMYFFTHDRDRVYPNFIFRQLLSSLTDNSSVFRTMIEEVMNHEYGWLDHIRGARVHLKYELGPGNYVGIHHEKYMYINEKYELTAGPFDTLAAAESFNEFKDSCLEGSEILAGIYPVSMKTMRQNHELIVPRMRSIYEISDDPNDSQQPASNTPTHQGSGVAARHTHQPDSVTSLRISKIPASKHF